MNQLQYEKSPYLLQHANQPVNWYAWTEMAFQKAKQEDKPIFLSVGYSTCHWCHVMAEESFMDKEVAALLNRAFIAIKVDREERPDVDAVYMEACQRMTGTGGWPMTIVMTPDQRPFYAATYLPKTSRMGMLGLVETLTTLESMWKNDREKLLQAATHVAAMLKRQPQEVQGAMSRALMREAKDGFASAFDSIYGGFGGAPKFPTPHHLMFLLRYAVFEHDSEAQMMVEKTLVHMYRGGIYDHIGGGFCRYSTDEMWLVPHFEKMLYDNALLMLAYTEAFQLTNNALYERIVRQTATYILREMTDGGFFSAQDADSEGEEGKYYVFTPKEIRDVLGEVDGERFNRYFGITAQGNFHGKTIPNLMDRSADDVDTLIARIYEYRRTRVPLKRDDKILTAWNALMIVALAKASGALQEPRYLQAAQTAFDFLKTHAVYPDGNLGTSFCGGKLSGRGYLDDYAFMAWACLTLYETTFTPMYLEQAKAYCDVMEAHFWSGQGFYLYGHDAERLIIRPKETYDGAMPSGNAVAGYVLARLARLDIKYAALADAQLKFLAGRAQSSPMHHSFALMAGMEVVYPHAEVTYTGANDQLQPFKAAMQQPFMPNVLAQTVFQVGEPRYQVCENGACGMPLDDLEALKKRLSAFTIH